ncbi:MAG: GDP-mannose 4,6-dehydratase [Oryzomonas sp.]|uniref:GDP-mannose 4,6-dehydratase n=1 Tax=Oryzomonas sp. TaxID=2855186 RepID=UPI002840CD18|nr:GDP-mannose 4,6-dehydratase [Oryzomonas sp.]MDR3580282.1 GDP-mannose 4,6-dehydratase [Oryzomonas sp.]
MQLRILITGGAGFIGSHLSDKLLAEGHHVSVIDDLSTGSIKNIKHLINNTNFKFIRDSISNEIVLDRVASETDVIVHLAAAVGVKLVVERPVYTIETNVTGTEQVLKAALRYGCKVLIASTSEVYGKGHKIPFTENDDVLLGSTSIARWGYAISKMLDESLAFAYGTEYGLPVVLFRLFNTVGPRQTGHYGMVIPTFMQQAIKGEPITVFGDGTQQRCFCDVSDVVRAIVGFIHNPAAIGQLFNIGGNQEVSMIELAEKVIKIAQSKSEIKMVPYSEAFGSGFEDMQRRVPNTEKIFNLLNWKPTLTLDQILVNVRDSLLNKK